MNDRNFWLTIAFVVVALLLLGAAITLFSLSGVTLVRDTPIRPTSAVRVVGLPPTWTPGPTPTETHTPTPAPTYTLVIQPGTPLPPLGVFVPQPTRVTNPYEIVIPTPTGSPLKYPVTFSSAFKVVTYKVVGSSIPELMNALNASALPDTHDPSARYYARTAWAVDARWNVKPLAGGCEVDRGSVTATITMTVPLLQTQGAIDQAVLARWNRFIDSTVMHEAEHVNVALDGARNLQREMGNLAPTSTCSSLDSQLSGLFDRSIKAIDATNANYDAKTNHGATQGAVFP